MNTLFLAHRIPYPPDKGDKIRSYHFLRHLCARGPVHLCTLMDDPADARHVPVLEGLCASVLAVPFTRRLARLKSLRGLLTGGPLSPVYFGSRSIRARVADILARERIDLVFAFCSVMAPYALAPGGGRRAGGPPVIVDFVDMDSDKWRQYGERFGGPLGWLYRREGRTLAAFEARMAAGADRTLLVSEPEADLLRGMVPGARVTAVPNGVDLAHFDPDREVAPFRPEGRPAIVFVGAMDYWPNVDAVGWFADAIFPSLRAAFPEARFHVVGRDPSPAVRDLPRRHPQVVVTGAVPDVRPYLRAADLVAAPMRFGRGVQNKVVEAMAMAKAVVTTPLGAQGLTAEPGRELEVADGAGAFAAACEALLGEGGEERRRALGKAGRAWVEREYTWDRSLARLDGVIAEVTP